VHAYRPDIDGLRAVAVLSVVAFHVFPWQFPGGFVGVDIFFVISGFLITSIICQDLAAKKFRFLNFYARRARRIFPALTVMLVACLVVGWFVLLPDEFRSLGWNAAAAAAFVANFAALQDAGYFAPPAVLKPLLHLWSLGVEEQYYLVWPLLLVLAWRRRYAPLAAVGIVFAVSFISNIVLVGTDPVAAFFLPVTRFWELMLGCGLAFALAPPLQFVPAAAGHSAGLGSFYRRHAGAMHETAAWAGLALIAAALLLIDPDRPFPGWWALLPTAGTALLILAGPHTSIARLILGRRAVVHVGLISYPLYLWHWPILVFERVIRFKEPTLLMKLAGVGVAFILADQTYRLIEKPIRFGTSRAAKSIGASIALASAGCLGLAIYAQDGVPQRIPEDALPLVHELEEGLTYPSRWGRCFLDEKLADAFPRECDERGATAARTVVLWGDSHAAHLYPGLKALAEQRGLGLAQYTASGCPPILSFVSVARSRCQALNALVVRKLHELDPGVLVMAAGWDLYAGRRGLDKVDEAMIRATLAQLVGIGLKRIVVIGVTPRWEAAPPRMRIARRLGRLIAGAPSAADVERAFPAFYGRSQAWDDLVQRALAGTPAHFISPLSTLCNAEGCLLTVPGKEDSTAWDTAHLTSAGSEFFVQSNARALLGE
jgi:peptidoglycan/LPS O-acetylase OafA/YrhL